MAAHDHTDDTPMRPNRRRRSALHVSATFMRLVAFVGLLLAAGSVWMALTGRTPFAGGSGSSPYLTLESLPQLQQAVPRGDEVIRIVDLPLWVRLLAYAPGVLGGVLMVLVALTTTRVLVNIAAARPFEAATARLMRTVGLLLAVGGVVVGLIDTVASITFFRSTSDVFDAWRNVYSGLGFTAGDWPWALIITGTAVLAAAAAFTEGARLQREVDSVV